MEVGGHPDWAASPPRAGRLLVRTAAALALAADEPAATGPGLAASAAGVVAALGPGLETRFRVGQRVVFADSDPARPLHEAAFAAPTPDDVNDEEACFAGLAAFSLAAIDGLGCGLGTVVAVIGSGLGGLLATELLDLSGIRAIHLDADAARRELARFVGAELTLEPDRDPAVAAIRAATEGRGCDGVLVAVSAPDDEIVALAAAAARDGAALRFMGSPPQALPAPALAGRDLTLGLAGGFDGGKRRTTADCLTAVTRILSRRRDRRLHVEQFITARVPTEADAGESAGGLGTVRLFPAPPRERPLRVRTPAHVSPVPDRGGEGGIAVLTSDSAALAELRRFLPEAGESEFTRYESPFDLETAAGSALADDGVAAVAVAARGDPAPVMAALKAGKPVLALPPLARDRDGLAALARTRRSGSAFLLLAHPWRHGAAMRDLADAFAAHPAPRSMLIRFGAEGAPEAAMARGVDLAASLAAGRPATVSAAAAIGEGGTVTALVTFTDGSLATLVMDAAAGVSVALSAPGGFRREAALAGSDRGEAALAAAFRAAVAAGGKSPVDEQAQIEICRAAQAVFESLRVGGPIGL